MVVVEACGPSGWGNGLWQRGEETIFPLELILGLVENVSPAMLDWIGETIAAVGMSQQATIDDQAEFRSFDGCSDWRLRRCTEKLAAAMETTSPGVDSTG